MLDSETSEQKAMDSMREHFRKVHQKKKCVKKAFTRLMTRRIYWISTKSLKVSFATVEL